MTRKFIFAALTIFLSFAFSAGAANERPFHIEVYGNFKRMLHKGDTSGKVALASISNSAGTYGIGAMADLRGEILVWDGRILISLGEMASGSAQSPGADAQAALLVTGQVKGWEQKQILNDMTQKQFERFVIDSAHSIGIDTNQPFLFIVTGDITDYAWHVVAGTAHGNGAGPKHQQGHANNRIFSGEEAKGKLVGFYSAAELEGVISHPGERFHVHYADDDFTATGHLDRFSVRKGATLLVPKQ
jgi:alpha-acetolactate decarboxylase